MGLSIVLPAYNEERNIEHVIEKIIKFIPGIEKDFEIIIVESGSTDRTPEITDALAEKYKKIKVYHQKGREGYGSALRLGFSKACKDKIFYMDSDGQFEISELKLLLPLLGSADIVSGYRTSRQDTKIRKLFALIYNLILKIIFFIPVRDVDCAFKLYKKEIFDSMELKSNTGMIDAEVLAKAMKRGFRIKEVGVTHYPRLGGASSYETNRSGMVSFSTIRGLIKEMVGLKKELMLHTFRGPENENKV